MKPFQTIDVPVDFSPASEEPFRLGQYLAQATSTRIVVLHVAHTSVVVSGGDVKTDPTRGESKDITEELRRTYPAGGPVQVEHRVIVTQKDSGEHVLEMVEGLGCDLIVMGTHGRTGLTHLLFGSVAEKVMRKARCPVLVVKAPDQ
jgi:nucleotide-binding universal stress UspA family protein